MATRGWKLLSAQCGIQKMAKTLSPYVTAGHIEQKESNSSPASLCQTGVVAWLACPNKASKNANCARSHGWDFACCPADSAAAASVAVRLPASECPVCRKVRVVRGHASYFSVHVPPSPTVPQGERLSAQISPSPSSRSRSYQRHCHIPGDLTGPTHSSSRSRGRVGAPRVAARSVALSGVPVVSRILPFQAVVSHPLASWRLVGIEWRHFHPPRGIAPVTAGQCPPSLKHGQFHAGEAFLRTRAINPSTLHGTAVQMQPPFPPLRGGVVTGPP